MATREFKSDFIYDLASEALTGLHNHIENVWIDKSIRHHEYLSTLISSRRNRFLRMFGCGHKEPSPLDEFIEERKDFLYSIYSDKYTLWDAFIEDYLKSIKNITRICNLAERNAAGSDMTRIDDVEYTMLNKYALAE